MKKIILSLLMAALMAPIGYAATIVSEQKTHLSQYETKELSSITITTEQDSEITTANGINLLIDPDKHIMWNANEVTASGSAVENGRIAATFTPTFTDSYKTLYIPVLADFLADESFTISGLKLRAYDREIGSRFIGLDINGDKVADANDVNSYKVLDDSRQDRTAPYPVTDLNFTINEEKSEIQLSWQNPPDYDLANITIKRTLTRNSQVEPIETLSSGALPNQFTDPSIQPNDIVIYHIYAHDRRNTSEVTEITINVGIATQAEEPETPTQEEEQDVEEEGSSQDSTPEEPSKEVEIQPTPPVTTISTKELNQLRSLYNYYKIRYSIKCRKTTSSACRWAKIDLQYTQEHLDRSDLNISLSEHELALVKQRIKYPEKRYQIYCEQAKVPAKYCTALGKALKRAYYFTNK